MKEEEKEIKKKEREEKKEEKTTTTDLLCYIARTSDSSLGAIQTLTHETSTATMMNRGTLWKNNARAAQQ